MQMIYGILKRLPASLTASVQLTVEEFNLLKVEHLLLFVVHFAALPGGGLGSGGSSRGWHPHLCILSQVRSQTRKTLDPSAKQPGPCTAGLGALWAARSANCGLTVLVFPPLPSLSLTLLSVSSKSHDVIIQFITRHRRY